MLVLVANEPRSYRDLVVATLSTLRPSVQVVAAEAGDLDREITHLEPDLVICSRLTESVQMHPLSWILLPSEGENRAVISVAGERVERTNMDVRLFLSVIDQTQLLTIPRL